MSLIYKTYGCPHMDQRGTGRRCTLREEHGGRCDFEGDVQFPLRPDEPAEVSSKDTSSDRLANALELSAVQSLIATTTIENEDVLRVLKIARAQRLVIAFSGDEESLSICQNCKGSGDHTMGRALAWNSRVCSLCGGVGVVSETGK